MPASHRSDTDTPTHNAPAVSQGQIDRHIQADTQPRRLIKRPGGLPGVLAPSMMEAAIKQASMQASIIKKVGD